MDRPLHYWLGASALEEGSVRVTKTEWWTLVRPSMLFDIFRSIKRTLRRWPFLSQRRVLPVSTFPIKQENKFILELTTLSGFQMFNLSSKNAYRLYNTEGQISILWFFFQIGKCLNVCCYSLKPSPVQMKVESYNSWKNNNINIDGITP